MEDEKIKPFYQMRGKEIVDALFDKGYFREDVNRASMQDIENFIAWYLQSLCKSAVKLEQLNKRTIAHLKGQSTLERPNNN